MAEIVKLCKVKLVELRPDGRTPQPGVSHLEAPTGDIVEFAGDTLCDIPARKILDNAPDDLSECIVLGWDTDGSLYFASTTSDPASMLWLLESGKKSLFEE